MVDVKISDLTELTTPDGASDFIAIVDTDTNETKKIKPDNLIGNAVQYVNGSAEITAQDSVNEGGDLVLKGAGSNNIVYFDNNAGAPRIFLNSASDKIVWVSNIGAGNLNLELAGGFLQLNSGNVVMYNGSIDMQKISIPSDPATNWGRMYVKQVDTNNDGIFIKIKKAGVMTEVQIA